MQDLFRQKVEEWIKAQKRSVRSLERMIGVPYGLVHNVLTSRCETHMMKNVLKIANCMGWSLDEIFCREEYIKKIPMAQTDEQVLLKVPLFNQILSFVLEALNQEKKIDGFSLSDLQSCVKDIYTYCFLSNNEQFDEKFAIWFVKQKITSKEKI
jgi:hypothetical protein